MSGPSTYESLRARIEAHEAEEARLLAEVERLEREVELLKVSAQHARVHGIQAERACIEGEVRYRAQRRRDAAAKRPEIAVPLDVMAYECDKIANMIANRRRSP
jgi:hypothetical protein